MDQGGLCNGENLHKGGLEKDEEKDTEQDLL